MCVKSPQGDLYKLLQKVLQACFIVVIIGLVMVKMPKVARFILVAGKSYTQQGALTNAFVSFDAIVDDIFSSMGCCVG